LHNILKHFHQFTGTFNAGDELVTPQNRMFAHGKALSEEEEKGLAAFDFTEF
jgi:hypothetical protein